MKKNLLLTLFLTLGIFISGSVLAQTWDDVIAEDKGDTVVVKGVKATGGTINTLWIAVKGDTTATGERTNPNRVYETIPDEVYLTDGTLELDATVPNLVITAPPIDRSGDVMPPLHIKQVQVDGSFDKTFFQVNGNIRLENQYVLLALTNNTLDREVQRNLVAETRTEWYGCIFEFTNWSLCFPSARNQTYKFEDCLFINIGNEPTIEKGLPFDSWNMVDTLWYENCTFLNAGGIAVGRTPNHVAPNFFYFNHNTVVNTTLLPFSFSTQAEMIVANNVMVNAGMIATYPGFYPFWEDEDMLPRGIINVDTVERAWIVDNWTEKGYPYMKADSTADESMRKALVVNNNAWWDPAIVALQESGMPAFPDTIDATWETQMMTMNSRTQAWFDNDEEYPYYYESDWHNVDPGFTNNEDLMDEWVSFIVSNGTPGAPGGGDKMPWWRTNQTDNIWEPDWPPLADLSYSDGTLNGGAMGGYPLGDLNWYLDDKASWEMTNESEALIAMMKNPNVGIEENEIDAQSSLISVYPNPASDMLYINSASELNSVMVYDVVGQLVKQVNLDRSFTSDLDISDLNNGVYILQVETVSGEYSSSKFVKK
jgi:hypothetical protein